MARPSSNRQRRAIPCRTDVCGRGTSASSPVCRGARWSGRADSGRRSGAARRWPIQSHRARLASRDGHALSCGCEHACAHACRAEAGRVGVGAGRGGRRMGLPPNKASTVFGYEYTEYRSRLSLCVYRTAILSSMAAGITRRRTWTGCGRGCERCQRVEATRLPFR